ncbi:ABC transporter permease [Mucilaginibacter sp. HD30]
MLKSYITIAWRYLWKDKILSLINILGLSAGIAFTMLIGAYVWGEFQVNKELANADNQYIILSKWKDPNMGNEVGQIAELPKALAENYPGLIRNFYRYGLAATIVSKGEARYRENIQTGDSTLLTMYGFKLLYGDVKTALNDPFFVVITQDAAIKYFGRKDVTGQTLGFENTKGEKHDFMISGVLDELPANSVTNLDPHNHTGPRNNSDFFFSGATSINGWNNTNTVGYVELQNGVDPKAVNKAMQDLMKRYETDDVIRTNLTPYLVSLHDYNLTSEGGIIKKMMRTLSCIALFILLMAIINFVNICIGSSSRRLREMGIRKVLGGMRKQLVWQFLVESIIITSLATILALLIYLLSRPYMSDALGKNITGLFSFPLYFIGAPVLFALFIGIMAGLYPAFVLSGLKSVESLKGKLNSARETVWLRKTLVAFQFATAAVVLIGTAIISKQISLFFNGNLGYNKDYLIYAQLPRDWSLVGVNKMLGIRDQLSQMPQIQHISLSFEIPDGGNGGNILIYRQGANPLQPISAQGLTTDNKFAETYGISIKAGQFFSPIFSDADSNKLVINETEAKALGWQISEESVGQKVMMPAYTTEWPFIITGVVNDYHFGSMHDKIKPQVYRNVQNIHVYRYFTIRVKPGNMQTNLSAIQSKWVQLMPGAPFEYHFMDDALAKVYASELQLKKAAYIATVLSIIIVLSGVFGLITLNIQKRTKEIGIRKVLGSSVGGIIALFLKDFLGVVLIAGAVACPLAYLTMYNWLGDFAYRINISAIPFLLSIILLTIVTAVLITLQTIKVAFANPIDSLRSD